MERTSEIGRTSSRRPYPSLSSCVPLVLALIVAISGAHAANDGEVFVNRALLEQLEAGSEAPRLEPIEGGNGLSFAAEPSGPEAASPEAASSETASSETAGAQETESRTSDRGEAAQVAESGDSEASPEPSFGAVSEESAPKASQESVPEAPAVSEPSEIAEPATQEAQPSETSMAETSMAEDAMAEESTAEDAMESAAEAAPEDGDGVGVPMSTLLESPDSEPQQQGAVPAEEQDTAAATDGSTSEEAAPQGGDNVGAPMVTLLFGAGSHTLTPDAKSALDAVAREMSRNPNTRIQLRAFASDEDDSPSIARRLSLARALVVRGYLNDKGIETPRMLVMPLGATYESDPPDRVDIAIQEG